MGKISLSHITKIEGHASLDLEIKAGRLIRCSLGSTEGSRYFEALLKGRNHDDAAQITSRICGICSTAHGIAAVMAMENCLGIKPSCQTVALRELQGIGERIRSHATHLYFLALPDYLGYESGIAMLPKHRSTLERALRLVKLGNDLVALVSGRVMHQVSTSIGGYTHFPTKEDIRRLRIAFRDAEHDIFGTAELFSSLKYPQFSSSTMFFSLVSGKYPMLGGSIKAGNESFKQADYSEVLREYHEPYSNANFVVKAGRPYFVGALARINNSHKSLMPKAKAFMKKAGFKMPDYNTFHNNLAQAVELVHYWEYSLKLLSAFEVRPEEPVRYSLREGRGIAAIEVPRGTLWHEYRTDSNGIITYANIITPTAQNLRNIQDDIAKYVQEMLDKRFQKQKIILEVEKLIRAYDPCFSCATHFLSVGWKED